jgi:hypothetical protein
MARRSVCSGECHAGIQGGHHAVIDEHNRQLREDLIPLYNEMVSLFTSRFHLAEPETRSHYATLVEFAEGWRRHFEKTIPAEVLGLCVVAAS